MILSNLNQIFSTLSVTFQLQVAFSNFDWLLPTSDRIFQLRFLQFHVGLSNLKLSNTSFFPTALSNYTYSNVFLSIFEQKIGSFQLSFFSFMNHASTDEDGRLRTVHPSMWTTDRNLFSDRPPHGRIRTLDQDYHFEMDEWTDF